MITKQYVGTCADFAAVHAWLAARLVPTYADAVNLADDGQSFEVVTGGAVLSVFTATSTGGSAKILAAHTANEKTSPATITTYLSQDIYGYTTDNAVVLQCVHVTYSGTYPQGVLLYAKDNTGRTVVVTPPGELGANSTTTTTATLCKRLETIRRDETVGTPVSIQITCNAGRNCTTLLPLTIHTGEDRVAYTPDVFICPTYQYAEIGKLTLNGKDYLSFGPLVIKDAANDSSGGADPGVVADLRRDMEEMEQGLQASIADFGAQQVMHAKDTKNPHGVTAEQVGAYTAKQVDQMLSDAAGFGAALAADADLDNVTTPGRYRVASAAAATSVANLPVAVAGSLLVLPSNTADSSRLVQVYLPNWGTTNQLGVLYVRQLVSGGWSQWFKIGDTTPTALQAGDDLDNLSPRDCEYYTLTPDTAATILHTPYTAGVFRVEVKFITGGAAQSKCVQVLHPVDGSCFYMRAYNSTAWGTWYRYGGEEVTA